MLPDGLDWQCFLAENSKNSRWILVSFIVAAVKTANKRKGLCMFLKKKSVWDEMRFFVNNKNL